MTRKAPKARVADVTGKQGINIAKTVRMIRILDIHIPVDAPTTITEVITEKNMRGTKVAGTTDGCPWSVELYGGNFYLVKVRGYLPTKATIPLHVVNMLKARLLACPLPETLDD